ncbi:MAG: FAD/NAD(P)-binding protein, partial [Desulfobacterales bacterium]
MKTPFTFTIVGGGLTATSMLCQFVEKAAIRVRAGELDPRVIDLSLFEKTDQFGPGFPHNHRYLMPFHITNMCAADMGVYADRPGDFQVWVDRHLDRLKIRYAAF